MSRPLQDLEWKMAHVRGGGVSCILCRHSEPALSFIEARMRHTFGQYGNRGICAAQYFTRNHVTYYRQKGDIARLRQAVARARELWGHRTDTDWLDRAAEYAAAPADLFDLLDG